jgi:hypothetical protein
LRRPWQNDEDIGHGTYKTVLNWIPLQGAEGLFEHEQEYPIGGSSIAKTYDFLEDYM